MRLYLAALFVVFAIGFAVALVATFAPQVEQLPWVLGLGASATLLILCVVANYLFNRPEDRFSEFRKAESIVHDLEARGLLVWSTFHASCAFRVAEYDDEGPHYFVKLDNSSVLYLNGQYLYDYEPTEDDPEVKEARRFPCTEFTIRRHRLSNYVVEIACGGEVFEPEVAIFADHRQAAQFEDGQVLTDIKYEQIKEKLGAKKM